jgi:hypothetical protein
MLSMLTELHALATGDNLHAPGPRQSLEQLVPDGALRADSST